ncbi:phage portal protein [Enterovirga rhinocerotis]|uniref:HK97 family phage portal protein n=1 Tax=Enterovirga rhinocerotis TaxID=1339210 RepID=A0A4R7CAX7_9HYPH|nr:phage portal protein [Enterovirga rhinocerotis]TDR94196.1 HK97 family phage portal protein [Enterovirga rhinocerotis]
MTHGIPSIPLARPIDGAAAPAPRAAGQSVFIDSLTDGRLEEFLRGGAATASGIAVSAEAALSVATAHRCVTLITGAVASMPIDLKRRAGKLRLDADDHPLWRVLRKRPNPWQTPSQFKRYMQACVLLRKGGFARIVRSGRKITALIPLHPDRVVEVRQLPDLTLAFDYLRPDGGRVTIPQKDMFYLCGLSLDGVRSMSVLAYARETVGESLALAAHARNLFRNGTAIGGVLSSDKRLTPEQRDSLREELESFRGASNTGKNLILQDGLKYDRLGLTLQDAQFIQSRELSQLEVCMFFGTPPHMVGLTTKTTSWGSGIEQQSQGFVTYTLQDWLTMWDEAIARDLVDDAEPQLYARHNTNALVRGDIKTRFAAYAVGRQWGWLSANDVLEKEDENPIEGGDTYLSPSNMQDAVAAADATSKLLAGDAASKPEDQPDGDK